MNINLQSAEELVEQARKHTHQAHSRIDDLAEAVDHLLSFCKTKDTPEKADSLALSLRAAKKVAACAPAKFEGSIFAILAEGLDAFTPADEPGPGWGEEHEAAKNLANAAPAMRDVLVHAINWAIFYQSTNGQKPFWFDEAQALIAPLSKEVPAPPKPLLILGLEMEPEVHGADVETVDLDLLSDGDNDGDTWDGLSHVARTYVKDNFPEIAAKAEAASDANSKHRYGV